MIHEPFFIDGENVQLYSVLSMPEKDFSNKVFLFCHPIFEEKKASHRVLVELTRKLAENGYASLMLDYSACGDSSGSIQDFTPSKWLNDIRTGINWLQKRFDNPRITLLGIRFGATLAIELAVSEKDIEDLVLIDPVIQGQAYINEILQQKCIREMMTFGEAKSGLDAMFAELEKNGKLDLDGIMISSDFSNEVKAFDISKYNLSSLKRILLIQQSPRKSLLPVYEDFQRKCCEGNVQLDISLLAVPPFWKAVDMADSETVCNTVITWCK